MNWLAAEMTSLIGMLKKAAQYYNYYYKTDYICVEKIIGPKKQM